MTTDDHALLTAYQPEGRTVDEKMQDVLRRREKWLAANAEAHCLLVISDKNAYTFGYWIGEKKLPLLWKLDVRTPAGVVWFMEAPRRDSKQ